MRTSDPAKREELLEHMLFLVEAQSRARRAEATANDSQGHSALEPQPRASASPATEDASPAPNGETNPEDPA